MKTAIEKPTDNQFSFSAETGFSLKISDRHIRQKNNSVYPIDTLVHSTPKL